MQQNTQLKTDLNKEKIVFDNQNSEISPEIQVKLLNQGLRKSREKLQKSTDKLKQTIKKFDI